MSISLTPYLSFEDNARDALEFYQGIFGGEIQIATFKDFGISEDPTEANKVMHGFLGGGTLTLMASDTPNSMAREPGETIALALSGEESDEEELRGYWDKLVEGGTATMPLGQAPWGAVYGQLKDRFGIVWMVNIGG